MLTALRAHPAPYLPGSKAVAKRLFAAGMFRTIGEGAQQRYALSTQGVDHAARLGAQRVIDSVNEAAQKRAGPGTPAGAAPKNWPFPVSGHQW